MNRGTKIFLWILILTVVVAVFGWQARQRLRQDEVLSIDAVQAEQGVPVDVVRARVQTLEDWRRFTGVAKGWEQVDLLADFRTRVDEVHVSLGEEIRAGKVLISLDPDDPARMMLNRESAEAQYETVRTDSLRLEALYAQGAVSLQQLDHLRAQCTAARVALQAALRAVELDTPVSGVVTALHAEKDQYVEGGAVVATVSNYDRVRVPLTLSNSERALVSVGQPARLRLEDGTVLEGRVGEVALSADSETRLYSAELVLDNPDHRVRPGALVVPEILVASSEGIPLLPRLGLIEREGGRFIYLVEEGERSLARFRRVETGIDDGVLTAVTAGLSGGEIVVVGGQNRLGEGARVLIRRDLGDRYYNVER